MNNPEIMHIACNATPATTLEPGMIRPVLACNPRIMLVRHTFKKGWKGTRHSHPHHPTVYVVRGHTCFQAQGDRWEMHAGDAMVVDGCIEHEAFALEALRGS